MEEVDYILGFGVVVVVNWILKCVFCREDDCYLGFREVFFVLFGSRYVGVSNCGFDRLCFGVECMEIC